MNIAVIPARGGSKRIPGKNIRPFAGRPVIAWSIDAARESGCFDHIVVSTDHCETAAIARAYGAEVPFIRPGALSDDWTPIREVVGHATEEAERAWGIVEFVCCVYAAAPFIQVADIVRGLESLSASEQEFAVAVASYAYPIQRALRISDGCRVSLFYPEHVSTRSQDLEEAYHDAGQFYWGRRGAVLARRSALAAATLPIVLPRYRVQDIDTIEDWHRAELMFEAIRLSEQAGE